MPGNVSSKAFCHIEGVEYYDWTLYWTNNRYGWAPKDSGVVIDSDMLRSFESLESNLFDDTFNPQHGSEIHVVPGCPIGMADIRKNYVIKRNADSGCCNVFSPLKADCYWIENKDVAIIPSKKAIVIAGTSYSSAVSHVRERVFELFPDIHESDMLLHLSLNLYLRYVELPTQWLSLLKGELKKPCISYKKLEFKTANEVSLDILYLVYKTGMQSWSGEAMKAFTLQLCALNEHNWRDYPGTIGTLFNDILNLKKNRHLCANELIGITKFPKACREMIRNGLQSNLAFKSQEDIDMSQRLIRYVVGLSEDAQFTTIESLARVFNEKKINMNCFYRTFDNIVKFRPKEFKNEEN